MIARRERILDQLDRQVRCSYQELAEHLQVSTMTIRRDVSELARSGEVIKTVGGVQRLRGPACLYEGPLQSRLSERPAEKQAIAREAARIAASHETIYMDGSSTCLELAKVIARQCAGLRIVTNSAMACLELARSDRNTIIAIGGQFDWGSLCFFGPSCEDAARQYHVDAAFVSTKGFVPKEGTYESFEGTFRIKQVMADRSAAVVLLADHSKFGQRALRKVLDTSKIHTVVTDDRTPRNDVSALRRQGRTVCVAPVDRGGR